MGVRPILKTLVLAYPILALCQSASAFETAFRVNLDTRSLITSGAGPYSVAFVLSSGSGVGDGTSTATISKADFGGGQGFGNPVLCGGATGTLESTVTMATSEQVAFFIEPFSPGATLSIQIRISGNRFAYDTTTPDRLAMLLLDGSGSPLATLSPGVDYFFGIDFSTQATQPDLFASDTSRPPLIGSPASIPIPTTMLVVPYGDLNGDGSAACDDLAIIRASYGKTAGQAGFDPRADVNGDGVVNILDLSAEGRLLPAGTVCH